MALTYHRSFADGLVGKYKVIAERLPPKCTVLEIGCASGYFSRSLMDMGYNVTGLEYDQEALAAARKQGVTAYIGNIENPASLAVLEGKFDRILLMDVLEHLRDPETVLRGLAPFLNPGGRVLITEPNVGYWAMRKDLLLGRWNYMEAGIMDRTHLKFFTETTWKELVMNAGFEVTDFGTAEAMIPLEWRLGKIGYPAVMLNTARNALARLSRRLFTVVFFIETSPVHGNQ